MCHVLFFNLVSVITKMPQTPSVEPVVRSRLLPRISFQTMLILMAISAVVMAVAHSANQGGKYATAAAIGSGYIILAFAALATIFLLAWAVAHSRRPTGVILIFFAAGMVPLLTAGVKLAWINHPVTIACTFFVGLFLVSVKPPKDKLDEVASPFAEGQLPPQIFPPRDPQA